MKRVTLFLLTTLMLLLSFNSYAERIKDVTSIAGVRGNQLIGYGLVVGLDGSGDTASVFTEQSMENMLKQLGISLPPGSKLPLKNVAAVSVSAELPAFSKPGHKIDVTVSSIANSKSLRGGTLLMTPLKGIDGNTYAMAQGHLVVGGLGISADDGSSITINVPSTGRIPGGATVERVVHNPFSNADNITLNLHQPDFTTAYRLADVINETMGMGSARAMDAASVRVGVPVDSNQRVAFVSMLENLQFNTAEQKASIVINSRTGTVIISKNVKVKPAAVQHGTLVVSITNDPLISQPGAFSGGDTAVVGQSDIDVELQDSGMFLFNPGVDLSEIVRAINQVGASVADLVAIVNALKQAGAIEAEVKVI